jgi:hypothetical protein
MTDFIPFHLMGGYPNAKSNGIFAYHGLYGLTEFRRGTVMEIKVVTRLGSCGTWTQIVFGFVLPPTTKGFPVILMTIINGFSYASDPALLSH